MKKAKLPSRGVRIAKLPERQLAELEDHLSILRDGLRRMCSDSAGVSIVAGQLRLLACSSSGTDGLIWRLCNRLNVADTVLLHLPAAVNADHPLMNGLRLYVHTLKLPGHAPPGHERAFPIEPQSLRDVIYRGEAVFTLGKRFSHEAIIKKIAEQIGGAHSDDGIEPSLAIIEEIAFNGQPPYVGSLAILADLVLEVGERVIAAAVSDGICRRRRYAPPVTISVWGRLRDRPFGNVAILKVSSTGALSTLDTTLRPQSFAFRIRRPIGCDIEVSVPLPTNSQPGQEVAFCMCYDHANKRLKAIGPDITGQVISGCDLGYVEGRQLSNFEVATGTDPYFFFQGYFVHEREILPREATEFSAGFAEAEPSPPEILL